MKDKLLTALIEKKFDYWKLSDWDKNKIYQIAQKYAEMKIKEFTQGVLDQYPIIHSQSSNKK